MLPYIVSSRRSEELHSNLLKNEYPVLFDGLHTTFLLDHPDFAVRNKFVRAHNIEHQYYRKLARFETNFLRKLYYLTESARLARYEEIIARADLVLPVSLTEMEYFRNKYRKAALLSPFHPFDEPECIQGSGDYILYHGDMSVNENAIIADFLTVNVFSRISFPCIIAGKEIPCSLFESASRFPNISCISNPDQVTLKEILRNAHINILPALESNGFRIKLLMALFGGRHCIANSMILNGTMLTTLCHVADTPTEILFKINSLMYHPFTGSMIDERRQLLTEHYNNRKNAEKLAGLIFSGAESR
jgi:glycosyltransferase involved in cell wall biosynthesis